MKKICLEVPSTSQVLEQHPNSKSTIYKSGKEEKGCSICQVESEYENITSCCYTNFHNKCIQEHFKYNLSCPNCKDKGYFWQMLQTRTNPRVVAYF